MTPLASHARVKSPGPAVPTNNLPTPTQHARWSPRQAAPSHLGVIPPLSDQGGAGASLELIAHSCDAAQRWRPNKLTELGLKLAALQYRLPFDAQSADLVERLFADLMTSVETNKKVMVELRNLKEKNIQLETALRDQLLSKTKDGGGPVPDERKLQSRILRLSRLSESLLFICSQLTSEGTSATADWSGASVSLLSLLLAYERHVEETSSSTTTAESSAETSTIKEFPPFLREFHSVWRAHEERDELQSQLKEKDRQISQLLTTGAGDHETNTTLPSSSSTEPCIEQHETNLLRAVEVMKAQLDARSTGFSEAGGTHSLLAELQKWKNQVKNLEGEKKTQEDHIRRLEKRFASVLKKQQELEGMCRGGARSASPNCGSNRSVSGCSEDDGVAEIQNRKHRTLLRLINDREIDAFESAREAWRHERILLESQKEEKEKEIQVLKRQIAQIEDDMDEAGNKYTRILGQLDKANEALTFAQNRIDFFERTEVERQQAQAGTIKQMQEMQRDLEELRSALRARNAELADQSVQLDDIGRTLVVNDAQLQSIFRERDQLAARLKKVNDEMQKLSALNAALESELRNIEESRDLATEKLQSQSDSLQQRREEVEVLHDRIERDTREIEQLKDEIDQMRMTLRKASEVKHTLEAQLTKVVTERSSYKQTAIESRQILQDAQDQYASLESRYRALLLELEGAEPQPEHLNSSLASMIPPTVWNSRVDNKNEEIRLLVDQIETLHKEVRAFRKSRDQAIKQKTIALEKLRTLEDQMRKLQTVNTSLKSSTQVLHKRLRNYARRIEMLDGLIAQQRNHILTHRMDAVPEDGYLEDHPDSSSVSGGKASAAVRYLMSRTHGGGASLSHASITPITISSKSSRPLSDPFRISPTLLSTRKDHVLSTSGPRARFDPTPFPLKLGGEPITPISDLTRQSKTSSAKGPMDGTIPPEASEDSGFVSPNEAVPAASTELLWVHDLTDERPSSHRRDDTSSRAAFEAGPSVSISARAGDGDSSRGQRTARQLRQGSTEEWSAGPSGVSMQVDRVDATERAESIVDISSGSEGTGPPARHGSSPMSLSGSDLHRAQRLAQSQSDSDTAPGYMVDYRDYLDNSNTWRRMDQSRLDQSLDESRDDRENQGQASRWGGQHSLMYSSRFSHGNPADMTTSGTMMDEESASMWQLSETSGGKGTVDKTLSNWEFSEGGDTSRLTTLRTKSIPRSAVDEHVHRT